MRWGLVVLTLLVVSCGAGPTPGNVVPASVIVEKPIVIQQQAQVPRKSRAATRKELQEALDNARKSLRKFDQEKDK